MSDYHVFCDESHIGPHTFRVQGGIWADDAGMRVIRGELTALRAKHPQAREFKWSAVHGSTPYRAYGDLISLFFTGPAAKYLSFKCMVVERTDDSSRALGKTGRDLGFYKTYYTLLRYRVEKGCRYRIRLDRRPSPRPDPEQDVADYLNEAVKSWNPPTQIVSCVGICSKSDDLMQLADLLSGAIGWDWNGRQSVSPAKIALADQIAAHLGWSGLARETSSRASRVNIWRYRPKTK